MLDSADVVKGSPLKVLSIGWGIQSFTVASMMALGEMDPVDVAIHADTTHEMAGTYAHAAKYTPWLERHGIPVRTVTANRPDVVREDWSNSVLIPAFTTDGAGSAGQVRRQCTHDWKIMPIRRLLREMLGAGMPKPGSVQLSMGISADEWIRMKDSDVQYINHVYPLVDLRITRAACIRWLQDHELDAPPKSSCTFCPYHSIGQWQELKRAGGPDWDNALAADEVIRHKRELGAGKPGHEVQKGILLYVHPGRRPLAEAIDIPTDHGQLQLLETSCDSGACGV